MSTTVIIGYGDGYPLESTVAVELLVSGAVVATASPDASGKIVFPVDLAGKSNLAVRMHLPAQTVPSEEPEPA
jgi:hypothetical protein